ncbi:MAG: recombinase family protein [Oligoflexia bacterium]|nr:recombinase family protein [Oligoflexia bacterium]
MQITDDKVTSDHLKRNAFLYIRQSSLKQVMDNTESTKRQYALKNRAIILGWSTDQIIIIDSDQGLSGADSINREGFQTLVAEVGMGKAGVVMGLEVSRLARNSTDWHRLLEICALTNTLILDEEGIYNPGYFNDRLLLGLKGTMSEAELHIMRARLRGGSLNKARRGELKIGLPVGLVYNDNNKVILDPSKEVQHIIKTFFKVFSRLGSAFLTVREFREKNLKFPRRPRSGPYKQQLIWNNLSHSLALEILHNPRYAGVFYYGAVSSIKDINGKYKIKQKPREQWIAFIPDSHEGYITLDQFNMNEKRLSENKQSFSGTRGKGPAREGTALLQGIAICGLCGRRMTIRYSKLRRKFKPDKIKSYIWYNCEHEMISEATEKACQRISGNELDMAISNLVGEMVNLKNLQIALAVQGQIESQVSATDKVRKQRLQQAQYEVDLSKRRYMAVDPNNRLVASTLEAEWNQSLRNFTLLSDNYEMEEKKDKKILDKDSRNKILSLANDFPRVWNDSMVDFKEKKRMIRLLVEDVTLTRSDKILVQIRFKGGETKTLSLPIPKSGFMQIKMPAHIVKKVDILLDKYLDKEIVIRLNNDNEKTGLGEPFTVETIRRIKYYYNLKSLKERLQAKGMLSSDQLATKLNVSGHQLNKWKKQGFIKVHSFGDFYSQVLYEFPSNKIIKQIKSHNKHGHSDQRLNS